MKSYTVYFELFGRKMKTTVEAESAIKAKEIIKSKIIFHTIKIEEQFNDYDRVRNIFGEGLFDDIFGKNFK